jgi:glycosyltransferase involved in cell wall biosynthesis
MKKRFKKIIFPIWKFAYRLTESALYPLNQLLAKIMRDQCCPNSVLHISYMVHIPYYTVKTLRRFGLRTDYLAIGTSKVWNKCDYNINYSLWPFIKAFQEFFWFWRVVAKYEIVHLHFMILLSYSGWELPLLKKMGRKIVVHYRGCEIRNRDKIRQLYPSQNICEQCDYNAVNCEHKEIFRKRQLAQKFGNSFVVTTPDLIDFVPEGIHLPFMIPEFDRCPSTGPKEKQRERTSFIKIVHATNHPGIEGSEDIQKVIAALNRKGYRLNLVFLRGVSHDQVLNEFASADLAIGKMKMGYYANAQIESMLLSVPTITYVRPQFMTEELKKSGFIFCSLKELPEVLEYYLTHPDEMQEKRKIAKKSILQLHDNEKIARTYIDLYKNLQSKETQG